MAGGDVLDDLRSRDLVHDSTDEAALRRRLDEGPTTLYCGFDPTADSLHLGNLQQILLLRRFQLAGHRPIALAGGATGMIGDPGGRSAERVLLERDELDRNLAGITAQLERFLDTSDGSFAAEVVDNRSWTEPMGVLEFLRDVGKHVTVNTMLARDSVRGRLEREHGISYTEFSYMLLQANDFDVLHRTHGCDLQVAGSDQWGNITAGVDLIRRRTGDHVHGLTSPLLLRSDGQKFGKSADGALWLDAGRTSPYRLYQHLLNVDDAEVGPMLYRLTFHPVADVREALDAHAADPGRRSAQRLLAREVTELVHGAGSLGPIEAASGILFGGDPTTADEGAFELLAAEIPTSRLPSGEVLSSDAPAAFVATGLARSKGEVRRNLGGHYLNGRPLTADRVITESDLLHGRYLLLRRGKTAHHLITLSGGNRTV